jgi:hypothetical protein
MHPDPLVRGMDPRIQIRIRTPYQNVMDPQNWEYQRKGDGEWGTIKRKLVGQEVEERKGQEKKRKSVAVAEGSEEIRYKKTKIDEEKKQ